MNHDDLPERWASKLQTYLTEEIGVTRGRLSAEEIRYNLKITFQDGSFAFFHYAFYLLDEELKEVAVFTEHCGYTFFLYSVRTLPCLNLSGQMSELTKGTEVAQTIQWGVNLFEPRRPTTHCTGARDNVLIKLVREIVA